MPIRVTTRHSDDFDIYTHPIDPARSSYASMEGYVSKVEAFYRKLRIQSAMWTVPEAQRPEYLEPMKTVEYVLEVAEERTVAYVNELSWSDYLYGKRADFEYSMSAQRYENTSILVETPILPSEVKARRVYHSLGSPNSYKLAEETTFSIDSPFG